MNYYHHLKKKHRSVVFIDVTQAFDCIWHFGLLFKLKPLSIIFILKSYLENRFFIVKNNYFYSSHYKVNTGRWYTYYLPQGSRVYYIIVYSIYNADLPKISITTQTTDADDINLKQINIF